MSWPKQMPNPPEGMYWKIGELNPLGHYRRIKLKKGRRTVAWTVIELPRGSEVGDIDAEIVRCAYYVLNQLDINTLADRQHARLDGYGKWE